MKKDEKRAVGIIFIVALILILALEYSNYSTEKRLEYEREKAEERLELSKLIMEIIVIYNVLGGGGYGYAKTNDGRTYKVIIE